MDSVDRRTLKEGEEYYHGLLDTRTGNSQTTVKKAKIDALISSKIDEILYFLF